MQLIYLYTILSVVAISVISLIGILTLSVRKHTLQKLLPAFVGLAVGALFGNAFIDLIPESFKAIENATTVSLLIIGGILGFFLIEKILHWHHSHKESEEICPTCDQKQKQTQGIIKPQGYLILVSDGFHNLLDGFIVGTSYLISVELGIATTVAIILHEIPQEIGDFAVLLNAGFSRARALFMNLLSAILAILGAIIALFAGEVIDGISVFILPVVAGGFIYIAGADLVPELHKTKAGKASLIQFAAIIVGVLAILLIR